MSFRRQHHHYRGRRRRPAGFRPMSVDQVNAISQEIERRETAEFAEFEKLFDADLRNVYK